MIDHLRDACAVMSVLLVATEPEPAAAGGCPDSAACPPCAPLVLWLQDEPAPGADAAFQSFDRPNLTADGVVAFTANLDGPVDIDDVLYVGDVLMAREGDPAPGIPGSILGGPALFQTAHQVNASGDVVFIASLVDAPAASDVVVYRNDALIAREAAAAPGITGRAMAGFKYAGLTDDGRVGMLVDLDGSTGDDSVVYLGDAILYREGDPVPGMDGTVWDANFDELQWNGRGDVIFEGNTSMPSSGDAVVFRRRTVGGMVVEDVVAQEGQIVSTTAGSAALGPVQQTALAENGRWALRASLADAPPEADAVILAEGGFIRREGDEVAELPGAVLGSFTGIAVNGQGDVLYLADLEGDLPEGVDEGLFLNCCLLVTDGFAAPGLPDGTSFTDLGFEDVQINDARQVVFQAGFGGAVSGDGLFLMTCSTCAGDLTGDGAVDVDDLIAMLLEWGGGPTSPGDLDGSGAVDVDDLTLLITAWGTCEGAPPLT